LASRDPASKKILLKGQAFFEVWYSFWLKNIVLQVEKC